MILGGGHWQSSCQILPGGCPFCPSGQTELRGMEEGGGDLQSSPAHLSRPHLTPTAPLPRGAHPSMHHPLPGPWYFLAFTPVSVLHLLPGINSPIPTLPSIFSPFKYLPALQSQLTTQSRLKRD